MTPMARAPLRWTLSIALSLVCCLVLASPALARGGGVGVSEGGGGRPGAGIDVTRGGVPHAGGPGTASCAGGVVGVMCTLSPFVGLALGATLFAWLASRGPVPTDRARTRRRDARRRAPPPRRGRRS